MLLFYAAVPWQAGAGLADAAAGELQSACQQDTCT